MSDKALCCSVFSFVLLALWIKSMSTRLYEELSTAFQHGTLSLQPKRSGTKISWRYVSLYQNWTGFYLIQEFSGWDFVWTFSALLLTFKILVFVELEARRKLCVQFWRICTLITREHKGNTHFSIFTGTCQCNFLKFLAESERIF